MNWRFVTNMITDFIEARVTQIRHDDIMLNSSWLTLWHHYYHIEILASDLISHLFLKISNILTTGCKYKCVKVLSTLDCVQLQNSKIYIALFSILTSLMVFCLQIVHKHYCKIILLMQKAVNLKYIHQQKMLIEGFVLVAFPIMFVSS